MDEEFYPIVFDTGSSEWRAGLAGNDIPSLIIPSMVGSLRFPELESPSEFVGSIPQSMRDLYSLQYPIQRGIVTDWDAMEKLIDHSYKFLGYKESEKSVLFSEPPLNPKSHQETLAQLMFEKFEVPAFCITPSHSLCLYSSGRNRAIVVNVGDGVMYAAPFFEGFCFSDGIQRQEFGGTDVTHCLQKHLLKKGHSYTTSSEMQIVKQMKEKHSYVALDYDLELASSNSRGSSIYNIEDGIEVKMNDERFHSTEILFQPSKFGYQGVVGIHKMIYNALSNCEFSTRPDIMVNFIISGGMTKTAGFHERLLKEMVAMFKETRKVQVVKDGASEFAVWIGGSILGSLTSMRPYLLSKQKYEEYGPSLLYKSFHLDWNPFEDY